MKLWAQWWVGKISTFRSVIAQKQNCNVLLPQKVKSMKNSLYSFHCFLHAKNEIITHVHLLVQSTYRNIKVLFYLNKKVEGSLLKSFLFHRGCGKFAIWIIGSSLLIRFIFYLTQQAFTIFPFYFLLRQSIFQHFRKHRV